MDAAILQRFRTQHEDDVVPVLLWFVTAHALGLAAYQIAQAVFRALGHTSMMTMVVIGGGSSTPIHLQVASYQAIKVQGVVFFLVFGVFWAWDAGVFSRWR